MQQQYSKIANRLLGYVEQTLISDLRQTEVTLPHFAHSILPS